MLLAVIFISFISLGLPDSLFGAAWPLMYSDLGAAVSQAGIISMTICFGTIISSLSYAHLARRFHTNAILSASILVTSISLFLFSRMGSLPSLLPVALTLGLGGGCVDSALNNYVTLHYPTSVLSFLHGFWGIGTTIGPILLGAIIPIGLTWRSGYRILSVVQLAIMAITLFSFPLWEKHKESAAEKNAIMMKDALRIRGSIHGCIGFFSYCSLEGTLMVWSATYMVSKGLGEASAASYASLFFWGMTAGRMLSGFVADRIEDCSLIRAGIALLIAAIASMPLVPASHFYLVLLLMGLGCAPLYPMMIHQTPRLYGNEASSAMIGLQMASAYVGSTFMPPLFGMISSRLGMEALPWFIAFFLSIVLFSTERKRRMLHSSDR